MGGVAGEDREEYKKRRMDYKELCERKKKKKKKDKKAW